MISLCSEPVAVSTLLKIVLQERRILVLITVGVIGLIKCISVLEARSDISKL